MKISSLAIVSTLCAACVGCRTAQNLSLTANAPRNSIVITNNTHDCLVVRYNGVLLCSVLNRDPHPVVDVPPPDSALKPGDCITLRKCATRGEERVTITLECWRTTRFGCFVGSVCAWDNSWAVKMGTNTLPKLIVAGRRYL